MTDDPSPKFDWLSVCDRVRNEASERGYEALAPMEQAVRLSDNFNFEQENGGLSQFFYNSDCSADYAEATALALRTIGAPQTAQVVLEAAALFAHPPDGSTGSTWGEYLSVVDPKNRLRDLDRKLPIPGEDVFSLLEAFIIKHTDELSPPRS